MIRPRCCSSRVYCRRQEWEVIRYTILCFMNPFTYPIVATWIHRRCLLREPLRVPKCCRQVWEVIHFTVACSSRTPSCTQLLFPGFTVVARFMDPFTYPIAATRIHRCCLLRVPLRVPKCRRQEWEVIRYTVVCFMNPFTYPIVATRIHRCCLFREPLHVPNCRCQEWEVIRFTVVCFANPFTYPIVVARSGR